MDGYYTRNKQNVNYYRTIKYGIASFLAVMPFIWWPWAEVAYELPRVWFVLGSIDVLILLSLPILLHRNIFFMKSALIKYIGLFLFAIILSVPFGSDPPKSIWGNWWRMDGVVTIIHLAAYTLLLLQLSGYRLTILAWGIGTGALAMSIFITAQGILHYLGYDIPTVDGAIGSVFGQPNFLAGYLVVTLPFVSFVIDGSAFLFRGGRLNMLLYFFPAFAIACTRSVGGIAGLLLFIILMLIRHARKVSDRIKIAFTGCGIIMIILLIAYSLIKSAALPPQILAESRQRIFMKGLLAFARKPVNGWGWADFDHAFTSIDWPYHFQTDAYVDKAHSNLLEILTTTGITGFIAYSALLFAAGKRLLANYRNNPASEFAFTLLAAFVLYIFHTQTNVTSIAEELVLWTVLGLMTEADTGQEKKYLSYIPPHSCASDTKLP